MRIQMSFFRKYPEITQLHFVYKRDVSTNNRAEQIKNNKYLSISRIFSSVSAFSLLSSHDFALSDSTRIAVLLPETLWDFRNFVRLDMKCRLRGIKFIKSFSPFSFFCHFFLHQARNFNRFLFFRLNGREESLQTKIVDSFRIATYAKHGSRMNWNGKSSSEGKFSGQLA